MWLSSTSSHAPGLRQTFRQEAHFLAGHPNFRYSAKQLTPQSLLPNSFAMDPILLHAKKQKIFFCFSLFILLCFVDLTHLLKKTEPYYNYLSNLFYKLLNLLHSSLLHR